MQATHTATAKAKSTHNITMLSLSLLLIVGISISVSAQSVTATISGVVADEAGATIAGAQVTARNTGTNAVRTVTSSDEGQFRVSELAPGEYEVAVERTGFAKELRRGIMLTVGRDAVINFGLKVGSIDEQVVVNEDASLVNTTSSEISALVNERTIVNLPLNGRDLFQLATLQIGVVSAVGLTEQSIESGTGKQKLSINGGRIDFNNFMLDGASVNESQNTTPGSAAGGFVGVDAIQEFQILTSNYSAEYGGAGGGIINLVSKSGTNDINGTAFIFHRNSAFDARNFFDTGFDKDGDGKADVPPFKRNQFGGSIGGPLRKDRTFIFGAYEGLREQLAESRQFLVPSDEVRGGSLRVQRADGTIATVTVNPAVLPYINLYPRPNTNLVSGGQGVYVRSDTGRTTENYFTVRGDHEISEKDRFFARYTFDDAEAIERDGVITDSILSSRNQYAALEETHIFSPTLVNSLRFAYNRSFVAGDDVDIIPVPESLFFVPGATALGFFRNLGGLESLSNRSIVPRFLVVNSFELSDHITHTRGAHNMKFGFTGRRIQFNAVSTNAPFGGWIFSGYESFLTGRPSIFAAPFAGSDAYRGIRTSLFAFYAQDEWKVRRNLTLNFGLRYEFITSPKEANDKVSNLRNLYTDTEPTVGYPFFKNPSLKDFAPRVGFAWDIFGDGKTSLRGGYGIFFAQPFPNIYRFQMSGNPPFFTIGLALGPTFPNAFSNLINLPAFVGLSTHEYEPSAAYVQQWNLGVQRELFAGITATVAYVGSRGVHLPTNANRNTSANFTILPNGEKQFPVSGRNPLRNPRLGATRIIWYEGNSYYNSMQVGLERRFAQGLQFNLAYTWSKSIDTASDAVGNYLQAAQDLPQDSYNLAGERGLSVFDRRHVFNLSTVYELPYKTRPDAEGARRVADFLFGGWQLNNIITLFSGTPFNPVVPSNNSRDGDVDNTERPDWAPGFSVSNAIIGDPNRYFDRNAFVAAPLGQFGNVGRNVLIGPNYSSVDLSLMKSNKIGEQVTVQFRAEAFNLLNRANFALPDVVEFNASEAGRIRRTVSPSRQLQFGLKLLF